MFKEILHIIPKLSPGDLAAMEKALTTRFGRIAKKFGKGLAASLAGGGIAGIALGLIDKLLNPLKETQEAIDRMLEKSDDIATNAKEFGTTAGRLLRLQAIGKSTGLDEGQLNIMLEKFQTAIAEASADPTKESSVRQFVGEKDIASAFYRFVQGLQKMETNQRILVQNDVFGEKMRLKSADFLQTDLDAQAKKIGGPTADKLTAGVNKSADLNDLKGQLEATRMLNDVLKKSQIITEGMVKSQDEQMKRELNLENQRIQGYQNLAQIKETSDSLIKIGSDVMIGVTSLVTQMTGITKTLKEISERPIMKGLVKYFGGK